MPYNIVWFVKTLLLATNSFVAILLSETSHSINGLFSILICDDKIVLPTTLIFDILTTLYSSIFNEFKDASLLIINWSILLLPNIKLLSEYPNLNLLKLLSIIKFALSLLICIVAIGSDIPIPIFEDNV